jgi:hypothetical protein
LTSRKAAPLGKLDRGQVMTTRVEYMRALMADWKNAPAGARKSAALKRLNSAEKINAARIDKAARVYLSKAVANLK